MGGTGQALEAALRYSGVVFAGAIPIGIAALLAAALRGAGNMKVPAMVTLAGFAILIPLSPILIFGWGPVPRLGVAGGGVAVLVYYLLAMTALVLYLRSPQSRLQLRIVPIQRRLLRDILGVGLLAVLGSVQLNLTVVLVTAAVGLFSDAPEVHAMGALYIRNVAPVYGAVGFGLALYFAGQGAGRVMFPVLAGTVRMIIAAVLGWVAVAWYGAGLSTLFQIVAIACLAYGAMTAAAMLGSAWGRPENRRS